MPNVQALPYGIQRTGDSWGNEPRILGDTARTFMTFHHWLLGGRIFSRRGLLTTLVISFILTCVGVAFGSWLWSADPRWLALYLWRPQTAALFGLTYAFNLTALGFCLYFLRRVADANGVGRSGYTALNVLVALVLGALAWCAYMAVEMPEYAVLSLSPLALDQDMLGLTLGVYVSYFQMFGVVDLAWVAQLSDLTGGWLMALEINYGEAPTFILANTVWMPTLIYIALLLINALIRPLRGLWRAVAGPGVAAHS
ncbi:MAG: hypothetical protein QNJ92_13915 [Alphaproteobacteria bacterium]|nr:hypothetical protein [Alphaproteobacteria bacterium]